MGFSATLWEWYGQDEYKRVLAVCEVIPALGFLAKSADEQRGAIPYCPACEAWSVTMLPVNEALTICGRVMPEAVRTRLQDVWRLCNSLPETAFHCGDWLIFDQEQWQPLREAAQQALESIDAVSIAPFLDELMLDCCNAVRGVKG